MKKTFSRSLVSLLCLLATVAFCSVVQADPPAPEIRLEVRVLQMIHTKDLGDLAETATVPRHRARSLWNDLVERKLARPVVESTLLLRDGVPTTLSDGLTTAGTFGFDAVCFLRSAGKVDLNFTPQVTAVLGHEEATGKAVPILSRCTTAQSSVIPVGKTLCFCGVQHPDDDAPGTLVYFVTPTLVVKK